MVETPPRIPIQNITHFYLPYDFSTTVESKRSVNVIVLEDFKNRTACNCRKTLVILSIIREIPVSINSVTGVHYLFPAVMEVALCVSGWRYNDLSFPIARIGLAIWQI